MFVSKAFGAIKAFPGINRTLKQAKAKKSKSTSKKASKGSAIFSAAKDLTDLKIGGNRKTPSSSMATAVHKVAKDYTKKKKTKKPTLKKVAKKTTGINPGSATINI